MSGVRLADPVAFRPCQVAAVIGPLSADRFLLEEVPTPAEMQNGGSDGIKGKTLTAIRWLALAGQSLFLVILGPVLGFDLPIESVFYIQICAILFNIVISFRYDGEKRLADRAASLQLAFDLTHMSALLFLTGGLNNPFSVLILAPSTVSAAILPRRYTRMLVVIALLAVTALAFTPFPLPWDSLPHPELPALLKAGVWGSLSLTLVFLTAYVARVGREARRRAAALSASRLALEKERRLSALGAQAAAAAHELGTPLGTLMLVVQDCLAALEKDQHASLDVKADLALMQTEVARCRTILGQLRTPLESSGDRHFDIVPVEALLREAAAPHESRGPGFTYINLSDDEDSPLIQRTPATLHALRNVMENAAGFALEEISVSYTVKGKRKDRIEILIDDDGPGFDAQIARQIGEPYVTNRRPTPGRDGGLGLGLFIAITLLERENGTLRVSKCPNGGARIKIGLPLSTVQEGETGG